MVSKDSISFVISHESMLKTITRCINVEYELLYDNGYHDGIMSKAFLDKGEKILKSRKYAPLIKVLCQYRQDIFSSDREIVALYLALAAHNLV